MKEEIKKLIKKALNDETELDEITIEIPKNNENGDYSSNIAMKICKRKSLSPIELANQIKDNINSSLIEKIVIAGPGFINFYLKKDYLLDNINKVIEENENYGRSNIGNNTKVNVEFVSVNPTGIIHLGHARGAAYGDSLSNILDFAGYNVTREYYINDAGNQMINMAKSIKERYKEILGLEFNLDENSYHGQEIIDVAQKIYNDKKDTYLNEDLNTFKKIGLEYFLNQIKEDLKEVDVNFDVWTSEQTLRDQGLVEKTIEKLTDLGYTYKLDNAIWLKTTIFGDEKDRVLVKTDGSYTYFLPDIAYHLDKLNRGFDELINVFGADHHGYVTRLKAAVKMLGKDSNKLDVPLVQMVRAMKDGKEYKLSKRTGQTITMSDLKNQVGKDALRYFFAARSIDTQMDFDIDLANKKTNENPVYYIQYAHARICSIINSYKEIKTEKNYKFSSITSDAAYNVLSKVYEFKNIVEKAAKNKEPHLITNYAYELANSFHSYYAKEKIITEDEILTKERIMLITAVKITIANALKLVGVSSPNKM